MYLSPEVDEHAGLENTVAGRVSRRAPAHVFRRPAAFAPIVPADHGCDPTMDDRFPLIRNEPLVPAAGQRYFAQDLLGAILDVTYVDPPGRYRVRVVKFCSRTGWHTVDSQGLSCWDGESFQDTIDVNLMFASGQIELVQEGSGAQKAHSGQTFGAQANELSVRAMKRPRSGAAKASKTSGKKCAYVPSAMHGQYVGNAVPAEHGTPGFTGTQEQLGFPLGANLRGEVVDITYTDPPATYRVRVLGFDKRTGWHKIDSKGLSLWDGDSFCDTVDLAAMYRAGQVRFLPVDPTEPPPKQAGRGGRCRGRGATSGRASGGVCRGRANGRGRKRQESTKVHSSGAKGDNSRVRGADVGYSSPVQDPPAGEDLIGRIVDVSLPDTTGRMCGPYRLCIVGFDRGTGCHMVEPLEAESEDGSNTSGRPRSLNLQELSETGVVMLVDGQEELLNQGHALVGEEIRFLPSESDAEAAEGSWLNATVVGWWPQDVLPPVAVQQSAGGSRGAVFVAEDTDGDRWQLSLTDTMLAMIGTHHSSLPRRAPRVLEIFAGSCALSVAFWRLGVEAEMYDVLLSERHDFRTDDLLLKQLAAPDIDLVHLAPPESLALDTSAMSRLLCACRTIHGREGGFVIECADDCIIWETAEMQQVAALIAVKSLSIDLQDFGTAQSTPIRLLTNCVEWLEPALAGGRVSTGATAHAEGVHYPRAFADAYAKGAIQALGL